MYAELIRIKCSVCKKEKEPSDFYNWKHERRCKPCVSAIRKIQYAKNPEGQRLRANIYRKKFPDKIKHTKLMQSRGISLETFQKMLKAQNEICAICKRPETKLWRGKLPYLCVDHCHNTGKVRGLLCMKCNRAIGLLEDNIGSLFFAIEYLNKYQK